MKTIKFGIIGCGLMGKEFAGAVGRWYHVEDMGAKPEIIAVCDKPVPKCHFIIRVFLMKQQLEYLQIRLEILILYI